MNAVLRDALGDLIAAAEQSRPLTVIVAPESDIATKLREIAEQASKRECVARRSNEALAAELRKVSAELGATRAELERAQTAAGLWEGACHEIAEALQPFFGETKLTVHSAVWAAHQVAEALDAERDRRLDVEGDLAATVHLVGRLVAALTPLAAHCETREGWHPRATVYVPVGQLRAARMALRDPRAETPLRELIESLTAYYRGDIGLGALEAALIRASRAGVIGEVGESAGKAAADSWEQ